MKWNKKFIYPTSTRALINGKRHYDVGVHEKLPSVTTILSATPEKVRKIAKYFPRHEVDKQAEGYSPRS